MRLFEGPSGLAPRAHREKAKTFHPHRGTAFPGMPCYLQLFLEADPSWGAPSLVAWRKLCGHTRLSRTHLPRLKAFRLSLG